MSEQLRRILLISLFSLAVVAIGVLLYFVFFRSTTPDGTVDVGNDNGQVGLPTINDLINQAGTNQPKTGGLPGDIANVDISPGVGSDRRPVDEVKANVLTPNTDAQDPNAGSDGSIRFFNAEDGRLHRVTQEGTDVQLGDEFFTGVEKVTWSPKSNETIIEFPDGSNIYYDPTTGKKVTLPKEYEDFSFSPTGTQIAFKYMHVDPERRVLAVSNPDGTTARTLESLGNNAHRVQVDFSPTGKVAASYGEFIDANRQQLGFIGLAGENFKRTVVEGSGLRSTYSPNGQQLLYSVHSQATDYKPSLWIVDADGDNIGKNRRELRVNTFASKCTYAASGDAVYCGVPVDAPYGFGLEPDILLGSPDKLYRIDTRTGAQRLVATPLNSQGQPAYAVSEDSLFVSQNEEFLFFRDAESGELIKVPVN